MRLSLQRTMLNKNTLRLSAILFGFIFWSFISSHHLITLSKKVPLCFYNTKNSMSLSAPEFLTVTLRGKKSDLKNINFDSLAVHIDAQNFTSELNGVKLTNKNLFLPDKIKLINYKPMNLLIKI